MAYEKPIETLLDLDGVIIEQGNAYENSKNWYYVAKRNP